MTQTRTSPTHKQGEAGCVLPVCANRYTLSNNGEPHRAPPYSPQSTPLFSPVQVQNLFRIGSNNQKRRDPFNPPCDVFLHLPPPSQPSSTFLNLVDGSQGGGIASSFLTSSQRYSQCSLLIPRVRYLRKFTAAICFRRRQVSILQYD